MFWSRYLVYRKECTRTTWTFRAGAAVVVVVALLATRGWWTVTVGRSLVCEASLAASDAILIENFDPNYLLFQRARQLREAGFAGRVLVPIQVDRSTSGPNDVAQGIMEVMAKISGVGSIEIVPVREVEPITLNAARDVQRFLERQHARSVIVLTPLFRSRRSALVYAATLGAAGIRVHCEPVEGARGVHTWPETWHGIDEVIEQWFKLLYYRMYVLPFQLRDVH